MATQLRNSSPGRAGRMQSEPGGAFGRFQYQGPLHGRLCNEEYHTGVWQKSRLNPNLHPSLINSLLLKALILGSPSIIPKLILTVLTNKRPHAIVVSRVASQVYNVTLNPNPCSIQPNRPWLTVHILYIPTYLLPIYHTTCQRLAIFVYPPNLKNGSGP